MKLKLTNPKVYKTLYKIYAFIKYELLKPSTLFIFAATIVIIILLWALTRDVKITSLISILIYSSLWLVKELLHFIIQKAIRNVGNKDRFIFPGIYFQRNNEGDPVEFNLSGINPLRFEFATERTAGVTADLNMKAYRNSLWATNIADKLERNLSHIRKNKWSILLVKSLESDRFLGYTHILPVSRKTWDKYLQAKISDNDFKDKYICSDVPGPKDQTPYGLILFSVASVFYDQEMKEAPSLIEKVGDIYEQAIVYHIQTYLAEMLDGKETVDMVLQNMSTEFLKFFAGVAKSTNTLSADGARLIIFEVSNNHFK